MSIPPRPGTGRSQRSRGVPMESPRLSEERQRVEDFRSVRAEDFERRFEGALLRRFGAGDRVDVEQLLGAVERSPLGRSPLLDGLPAEGRALAVLMFELFSFTEASSWLPERMVEALAPSHLDALDRQVELHARDMQVVGTWWAFLGLGLLPDPADAWRPGGIASHNPTLARGKARLTRAVQDTRPAPTAAVGEKLGWVIASMTGAPPGRTPTWHALISDSANGGAENLFAFDAGPEAQPRTLQERPLTHRGKCLAETFLRAWTHGAGAVIERHRDEVEQLMTRLSL